MKSKWLLCLVLIFVLTSCTSAAQSSPAAGAGKLLTWIDSPLDGSRLPLGTYEIVLHANAPSGISSVDLFINNEILTKIPPDQAEPYMATIHSAWVPQQPGIYQIRAEVHDVKGNTGGGDPIQVEVLALDTPTATSTPPATSTSTPMPTSTATLTPTPSVFLSNLRVEPVQAFVGNCGANQIQFTAQVTDPTLVKGLVLFVKLQNISSGEETGWNNGYVMSPSGTAGSFFYTLSTSQIPDSTRFDSAYLKYQFVGYAGDMTIVDRSIVYRDVTITRCGFFLPIVTLKPQPTFFLFTPVPTATPIVIK